MEGNLLKEISYLTREYEEGDKNSFAYTLFTTVVFDYRYLFRQFYIIENLSFHKKKSICFLLCLLCCVQIPIISFHHTRVPRKLNYATNTVSFHCVIIIVIFIYSLQGYNFLFIILNFLHNEEKKKYKNLSMH